MLEEPIWVTLPGVEIDRTLHSHRIAADLCTGKWWISRRSVTMGCAVCADIQRSASSIAPRVVLRTDVALDNECLVSQLYYAESVKAHAPKI